VSETYQQRFNRRHYDADPFTWAHRHLPERVRMWSPWWLRHVVAVERTSHDRTRVEAGLWPDPAQAGKQASE